MESFRGAKRGLSLKHALSLLIATFLLLGTLGASAGEVTEIVDSELGLYNALANTAVTRIVIKNSIKLQQEVWANIWTAVNVTRDLLLESSVEAWDKFPVLDFSFIASKVLMAPGVTVTFRRLAVSNVFSRIKPTYDFFAPSAESTTIVWQDVIDHLILCMPLTVARDAWSSASRPNDTAAGGPDSQQNVTLTQTEFCHDGLRRCFTPVMQGWDMITYGTSGYRIAWDNAITVCDEFATQECIEKYGPDLCYATTLKEVLARRASSSGGSSSGAKTGIIAGCVVAGVIVLAAASVFMVCRHRASSRGSGAPGPPLKPDLESGNGKDSSDQYYFHKGKHDTDQGYRQSSSGPHFLPVSSPLVSGGRASQDTPDTNATPARLSASSSSAACASVGVYKDGCADACAAAAPAGAGGAHGQSSSGAPTRASQGSTPFGSALLHLFRSLTGMHTPQATRGGTGSGIIVGTCGSAAATSPNTLADGAASSSAGGLHHRALHHTGSFNMSKGGAAAAASKLYGDTPTGELPSGLDPASARASTTGTSGVRGGASQDLLLARFLPGVAAGLAGGEAGGRHRAAAAGGDPEHSGDVTAETQVSGEAGQQEVMLGQLIGSGSFGKVYKGTWRGACVAVKVIGHDRYNTLERIDNELRLSLSFDHRNVVRALSYITCSVDEDGKPTLTIQSRAAGGRGRGARGGGGEDGVDTLDFNGSRLSYMSGMGTGAGGGMIGALYEGQMAEAATGLGTDGQPLRRDVAETWVIQEYMGQGTLARLIKNGGLALRPFGLHSSMPSCGPSTLSTLAPPTLTQHAASLNDAEPPAGGVVGALPAALRPLEGTQGDVPISQLPVFHSSPANAGRARQPLPPSAPDMRRVAFCALDVARGLQYLHTCNVVHGDLKPGNILLAEDPDSPWGLVAKLADFGLSRALASDRTHLTTNTLGTVSYMCPEVLSSGKVSPASCVYSYGIILWELVSGRPPHFGSVAGHIIKQVVIEDRRPDFSGLPGVPAWYSDLARRCWHKDSTQRPTMAQVVQELQAQIDGLSRWDSETGGINA